MSRMAILTLTFALLISGCSFFNSRDPEYKAAQEKKAEAVKTEEQKAAEAKAKKEKEEKAKKEKEESKNASAFSSELNDVENREVNKAYENQRKSSEKQKKEVFGLGDIGF